MPNTSVRAAAEGMPAINRRRLLVGLAAASTAAATVAATIATAATISENPELLRLGGLLPALEAEYHAAAAVRTAIVKRWSKRWPSAPTELHDRNGREVERDLTGFGVLETNEYGEERCRHILTTKDLEWHTARARCILKGRGIDKRNIMGMNRTEWEAELDELVEQHRIATAYEAEQARILKASQYEAADKRQTGAVNALCEHIHAILREPETSMDGVVVKAQALAAWGRLPKHHVLWRAILETHEWGPALAASIMRVAGEAVQS